MSGGNSQDRFRIAIVGAALRRLPLPALTLLAILGCARAASLSQDLGQGLHYLRPTDLSVDIPPAKSEPDTRTLIIDLRGSLTEGTGGATFAGWLAFRKKAETPVIVLLNGDTDPNVARIVTETDWPALLSLSPQGVSFPSDIQVDTSAEADRKACAAIARGDSLDGLISTRISKERLDEAKLAKSYEINGRVAPRETEEPKKHPPAPASEESSRAPDLVLARAVQIHHAMLALRLLL
ncbi:MAG: hypothetical protein WC378_13015 [Opitutaceae bacterium]|jgi:hypothetical protein